MKRAGRIPRAKVKPSRKTVSRKRLERELDALCRHLVVDLRDKGTCQKTGATERIQWCHVYTRAIKSMRWHPVNSLALASGAHLWQHHRPLEAAMWFEHKFPERARQLRLMAASTGRKVDLIATRLWLLQQIQELEVKP